MGESKSIPTLEGFLPLKVTGDKDQYNLDHAQFLVRSLDYFWKGTEPFRLTVAVPAAEIDLVKPVLVGTERIALAVVAEQEIVPELSRYEVNGWYKQMVLKLAFSNHAASSFYITFDADMMCVRPISIDTLFHEGKAVTEWEPKDRHPEWWRASRDFLKIASPKAAVGLSVTPNILSSTVARDALRLLSERRSSPGVEFLLSKSDFKKFIWTEYSLYTEAAEELELLNKYHLLWDKEIRIGRPATLYNGEVKTLHVDCSLWNREVFQNWNPAKWLKEIPRGYFMIFQSSLGIPANKIQERTRLILGS